MSLVWGGVVVGPAGKRAAAIEAEVAATGGTATAAHTFELDAIRRKLGAFALADLALLGTAVVTMATALLVIQARPAPPSAGRAVP